MDLRSGNYATTAVVINKKLWDGLPEDIQKAMSGEAEGYLDSYMKILMEHEDAACTKLKDANGTITILDQSEADKWATDVAPAVKASWKKAVESSGSEADADAFYDEYTAAVKKFEEGSTYEPALQRCAAQ